MRVYTHQEETEENLRRCLVENKRFADQHAQLVNLFNRVSSENEGLRCRLKEARCENMSMIPIVHVVFTLWVVLSLNQTDRRRVALQAWGSRSRVRLRVSFHEWVHSSRMRRRFTRDGLERLVCHINRRISAYIRGLFVYSVRRRHWIFVAGNRLIDALEFPIIRSFRALTNSPKPSGLGTTVLRTLTRCIRSKVKRCTLLREFGSLKKRIHCDNLMDVFSRHRKLKILQYLHSFVVISNSPPSPSLPETDSMGALVSCIALRDVLVSHHKGELLHVIQLLRPFSLSDSLIAKRMMFSWFTFASHLAGQRDALLTAYLVRHQYRILVRFFRGFRVSISKPKAVSRIAHLIRRRLLRVWEFILLSVKEQEKRKLELFSIRHCNFFPQRQICLTWFATKQIFHTSKQIVRRNFAILRSVSSDKPFQVIFFLEAIRRVVNVIRLREKHLLMQAVNEFRHNILRKDNLELAMIADRNSRQIRRIAGVQTEGDIDQELDAYADIAFELEQQLNLSEARNSDLQESLSKLKENYSLLLLSRPVSFRDG